MISKGIAFAFCHPMKKTDFLLLEDIDPLGRVRDYVGYNFTSDSLPFCGFYRNVFGNSQNLFNCKGEGS
jgi:hypothetical protein